MSKKKQREDRQILPGAKRVPVLEGQAEALVFPLGFRHLKQFNDKITRVLIYISNHVKIPDSASEEEAFNRVLTEAVPILLTDMLDLLEECVRFNPNGIKFDDLPHWDVPIIIEEWLTESFGEPKKRDPWRRAIESTVARFTGQEMSLSQIFSKGSSPQDGPIETSSESDSRESPIED